MCYVENGDEIGLKETFRDDWMGKRLSLWREWRFDVAKKYFRGERG